MRNKTKKAAKKTPAKSGHWKATVTRKGKKTAVAMEFVPGVLPAKRPAKAWTPTPDDVREFNGRQPCPHRYIGCKGQKGHSDCPHSTEPKPAAKVTTWRGWGFVLENGGLACHGNRREVASTANACGGKLVRVEARLTEVEG